MPDRAHSPHDPVTGYGAQCTRVYTRTGKRAHLLSPLASPNMHGAALCGTGPEWFTTWHGTGSQQETELAASLPLCKYCEKAAGKAAGAKDAADLRLAELGRQERATP